MIIVRAPFRVSLFGGGTDFKDFFKLNGAVIISLSIDKYCYVTLTKLLPYFNKKYRLSWSKIEEHDEINEIKHPSIRACLEYSKITEGLEIHTVGDLPARSGLGSSSAFTAALLGALKINSKQLISTEQIAKETIFIEQDILKEKVGIQDQIQVCHGGFNITNIFTSGEYSTLSLNETSTLFRSVNDTLILVYSGIERSSSEFHNYIESSVLNSTRQDSLHNIHSIAKEFSSKLVNHNASFELFSQLKIKT